MTGRGQSEVRERIRASWEERVGPWPALYDPLLEADPELTQALLELCAVPVARGALEPVTRELIGVAVNASTTQLYEPALRAHVRAALSLGADPAEIVEVLELASVLGIHSCTLGMPLLAREIEAGGGELPALDERRLALRERFRGGRGMWPAFLDDMLRLDPELLEAYLGYSTVPWRTGRLAPRTRELVYLAVDAATTHLYEVGTRIHLRNALAAGATREELLEVLELTVQVGINACTMALPILLEELAERSADAG
jgi:AhpD family alkylhydroperoxidase